MHELHDAPSAFALDLFGFGVYTCPSGRQEPYPFTTRLRVLKRELVDMDRYAHAHARHNGLATGGVERDHYRDALPHFGEIAARVVLGWE